ncbi:Hint domain-containing protein [Roseomonas fluvialis]|uniref:Hedgehog/Intein (Hint) domain-containing protein n=1 Tax=Roseomonas fluvialis TaxID=1750527 RepID=A0ABN6P2M7_9PROT|nr:Hint domain-containing protein [Roseomonas fluvialis]BDG72909.1 hypothetical protein Rmf_28380 [Roseomonas fluvialis]
MSWSQFGSPTAGPTPQADTYTGDIGDNGSVDGGIDGGGGDDSLSGNGGADYLSGGAGIDLLYGGAGLDTLDGGTDGDSLFGNDDADTIEGGDGKDLIDGGADTAGDLLTDSLGGAWIFGGDGNDTIQVTLAGASDNSTGLFGNFLEGGGGNDLIELVGSGTVFGSGLYGKAGDDTLVGADAFASLFGDEGNDSILGGSAGEALHGGVDDDVILGGGGDDSIYGDNLDGSGTAGNDSLDGGAGNDTIDGGAGDDTINGASLGWDSMIGGDGINTLDFSGAAGPVAFHLAQRDVYEDGNPTDDWPDSLDINGEPTGDKEWEYLEGFTVAYGSRFSDGFMAGSEVGDSIFGQAGDDRIFGNTDDDTLDGGTDNDYVVGEEGHDLLAGGGGDDTIVGGRGDLNTTAPEAEGADTFEVGEETIGGADTLDGGGGDDLIHGMEGSDSLVGGIGEDTITGGTGDDIIDAGDDNDLVIWRPGDGNDFIDMGDGTDTLRLAGWDNDEWEITDQNGFDYILTNVVDRSIVVRALSVEFITCFTPGTRILSARGEVPVETLRAGDLVAAPGRGAPLKPVRWVGHTRVDIAHHRDKRKVAPILLRAGALGAGVPTRDLRVSPEHAFLLDGRLVPAHLLVNGSTIVQETWQRAITYWHVELEQHGVLVAEGALAESYFDDGNRHLFDNGVIALHLDLGAGRGGGRYAAEAFAPPLLSAEDPALARITAALPQHARARQG